MGVEPTSSALESVYAVGAFKSIVAQNSKVSCDTCGSPSSSAEASCGGSPHNRSVSGSISVIWKTSVNVRDECDGT